MSSPHQSEIDPELEDEDTDASIPAAFEAYAEESLPNATPRGHGKDGTLFARFARTGSKTRLVRDRFSVPLHLTGTLSHDPLGPTACIQEPTGGVTHGDRHEITIDAIDGATAVVTTQSATKIHSMHSDYAHLDTTITVDESSYLEYLPGAVIVNEDARLLQTTEINLASTSVLLTTDIFAPDGLSAHTPFSFEHYRSQIDVYQENALTYTDVTNIEPDTASENNYPPAQFTADNRIGTLYIFAPDPLSAAPVVSDRCNCTLADLVEQIRSCIQDGSDDNPGLTAGVTRLPADAGICVRAIGETTDMLQGLFSEVRESFRQIAFDISTPTDRWY
ncbi:urease accessory protein UreD [Salinarchaeum sp. IM2453]|uniref:urease accessory protein UreD n=1 Tax=Salinarchaeum sp. IM2453 TaxID=2862870 RepID=UPI001C830DE9|nr:urease accessory protein UreD [Salinarchaeum sp. IM2453]QZA88482.1 urease accessory protein UreD [Salinarchaeum sp. IM2453]